jgi:DNA-binding winged helix-turn-helix (wHTH) protein
MLEQIARLYVTEGIVVVGDQAVQLSRQETTILRLLAHPPGRLRTHDELAYAIDPNIVLADAAGQVRVNLSKLRRKFAVVGLELKFVVRRGIGRVMVSPLFELAADSYVFCPGTPE